MQMCPQTEWPQWCLMSLYVVITINTLGIFEHALLWFRTLSKVAPMGCIWAVCGEYFSSTIHSFESVVTEKVVIMTKVER